MRHQRTGSWRAVKPIVYQPRNDGDEGAPVLSNRDRGIPPTPALLIGAANALLGHYASGAGVASIVVRMLEGVQAAPDTEWSAAFVHHAGYWAHYDNTSEASSWPLPAVASCAELGRFADEQGILTEGPPREGDV